jgi:ABC-type transporter Mla MlaB component
MSTIQAQIWKGSTFNVERIEGKAPGTIILRLSGPFTARDMHGSLTPDGLSAMFDFQPGSDGGLPSLNILDLTSVPYMDSSGLGVIIRHCVRCKTRGVVMIAAGAGPRILDLFKMTKVDGLFPTAATIEEAETR